MLTRRRFFLDVSATLGVGVAAAAQGQRRGVTAGAGDEMPPAIAALPSFVGRVAPFTNDERQARIERARKLMVDNGIHAIVMANTTASSVYFANIRLGNSERLWALVIPAKAKPFVVCPHFETERAHELLSAGPFRDGADVLTWQEDENPFALLVKGLKERGIKTGKIGLDENMKFVFADSLAKAGPGLQFVSATPVTAGCRMIKDAHEVQCLRTAGAATLAVYEAVYKSLKEGMTTGDVRNLVAQAYGKTGLAGEASLNIGEFTASPHGSRRPQTIKEGVILVMDDGCDVEGYTSDITRTFVLGKPSDKMKQVFDVVKKAQSASLKAAKPGAVTGVVDAAARKVLDDAGYGPGFKYLTHRVGHGLGMDMHEWPYLVDNNMFGPEARPVLKAGMVTSNEPGIYIPGEFGVRLEDDMHITNDGAELLTPQSMSLEDPFGKG
jgi:Xaa-Pro dipeptidase